MEQWANGVYTGADQSQTIQLNSKALGSIEVIDTLMEYFTND